MFVRLFLADSFNVLDQTEKIVPTRRIVGDFLRNQLGELLFYLDETDWVFVALFFIGASLNNNDNGVYGRIHEPRLATAFNQRDNLEMVEEKFLKFVSVADIKPRI